jgi:spore germination cell wall hydrolase CwlJ-like protein
MRRFWRRLLHSGMAQRIRCDVRVQCCIQDPKEVTAMKLAWLMWLASTFQQPVGDHACLAATIYLEARSESIVGQMAVAEVAMRRRESGQWGNSLCAVLKARGQFALSTTSKNYIFSDVDSWREAWLVADVAMEMWTLPPNMRMDVVPKADHFYAASMAAPSWAKGNPLAVIGDHSFFRAD